MVERCSEVPLRATKLTSAKMAERYFDASLPAVVLLVALSSGESNPSSTIRAMSLGNVEQVTDLDSTPNILMRRGTLTAKAPSVAELCSVSQHTPTDHENGVEELTSQSKVQAKSLLYLYLLDLLR